ncbi:hypothetical protein Tco_0612813 [Tanacetum coccineum]
MGLLDFIKTADPRKVQAVEVQKGDDQVTLLESTRHWFMPLVILAAGGSSSAAAAEVSAPTEEGQEDVASEEDIRVAEPLWVNNAVRQSEEEVVTEQPKKVKKKRLLKLSDVLLAKKLRVDHPTLVFGTGGKTLAGLEQIRLVGSRLPDREQLAFTPLPLLLMKAKVFWILLPKREPTVHILWRVLWYFGRYSLCRNIFQPGLLWTNLQRWNITNDSLLDDGFSCRTLVDRVAPPAFFSALRTMDYDQLYTEFNVGAARQVCLGAEVRSRTGHELELKKKLRAKYNARGRLLEEKDLEILRLKSQLAEKEAEAAEVIRLRDQVSSLSGEKSALTAKVSVLKMTLTQKDHDIFLLDSRAAYLASTLDDTKVACAEAGDKITSLASERDRLASEAAKASDINAVKALEDVDFPLVHLLKSKKDVRMDEVLDCFLLDGPLAGLPEAAFVQPCIEQLSVPIHHAGDKAVVGETSLSFTLMNVHARAEGAKKHVAALCKLMMEIVSAPLSSQTWVGEASTSLAPLSVEDYDEEDTDEALGSVVALPKLETQMFS